MKMIRNLLPLPLMMTIFLVMSSTSYGQEKDEACDESVSIEEQSECDFTSEDVGWSFIQRSESRLQETIIKRKILKRLLTKNDWEDVKLEVESVNEELENALNVEGWIFVFGESVVDMDSIARISDEINRDIFQGSSSLLRAYSQNHVDRQYRLLYDYKFQYKRQAELELIEKQVRYLGKVQHALEQKLDDAMALGWTTEESEKVKKYLFKVSNLSIKSEFSILRAAFFLVKGGDLKWPLIKYQANTASH